MSALERSRFATPTASSRIFGGTTWCTDHMRGRLIRQGHLIGTLKRCAESSSFLPAAASSSNIHRDKIIPIRGESVPTVRDCVPVTRPPARPSSLLHERFVVSVSLARVLSSPRNVSPRPQQGPGLRAQRRRQTRRPPHRPPARDCPAANTRSEHPRISVRRSTSTGELLQSLWGWSGADPQPPWTLTLSICPWFLC